MMRESKAYEKLLMSTINAIVVLILYLPFHFIYSDWTLRKIILILLFFLYNLFVLVFNKNRCVGMIVFRSYYDGEVVFWKHLLYNVLYTLSFASLLFWVFFPFDVFLVNIFLIQLPVVLKTGTTLHGYLSGGIKTMIRA